MKPVNTIVKILTALAAVAGAVYIVATYGEQIVSWAKKVWNAMPQCPSCEDEEIEVEFVTEDEEITAEETPVEEISAEEEAPVEETPAEEPAPEVVVAENEPVAAEEDFAE